MTKIRPYRAEDYPAIVRLCEECSVEPIQAYALASGIALIYERSGRIIGTVSAIYQGGKAYADNLIVLGNSPHVANSLLEHLMTLLRFVGVHALCFAANKHVADLATRVSARIIEDECVVFIEI